MHTAPHSGFFPSAPQMQTNHRRHLRSRSLQEPDISRPPQFAGGAGGTERAVACLGQSGHRETKPGLCLHSLSKAWKKKKCVHQNVLFFFFYHCGTSRIQAHKYDSRHHPQEAYKVLRCRLLHFETVWGMRGHGAVAESGMGRSRGFVYEV